MTGLSRGCVSVSFHSNANQGTKQTELATQQMDSRSSNEDDVEIHDPQSFKFDLIIGCIEDAVISIPVFQFYFSEKFGENSSGHWLFPRNNASYKYPTFIIYS